MPQWHVMTQAERLRAALTEAKLSNRQAGSRLASVSRGALTPENARASIVRWRRGGGISDENAERLSAVFRKPPDHFKKPRPQPTTIDRIRQLAADLQREVDRLEQAS